MMQVQRFFSFPFLWCTPSKDSKPRYGTTLSVLAQAVSAFSSVPVYFSKWATTAKGCWISGSNC